MNKSYSDLFYTAIIQNYVQENPRFLHRSDLSKVIQESMDQDSCRFVLITGAPLTGKSTIMAQLARDNKDWLRYFIRRDQRSPLGNPGSRSFLLQSGFQLVALHPELFGQDQIHASVEIIARRVEQSGSVIGARIKRIIASPFVQKVLEVRMQVDEADGDIHGLEIGEWVDDPRLLGPGDLAELALFGPARTLQQRGGGRIVILVDALDELRYHPQPESLLEWLVQLGEIPANIRFILSSREDEALLGELCRAQVYRLHRVHLDDDKSNAKAVREYATRLASEEPIQDRLGEKRANFIEGLINLAGTNLGYLDILARALDQALLRNDETQLQALLELRGLPNTFLGLYAHFLDQVRCSVEQEVVEIETPPGAEHQYLRTWPAVMKKIFSVLTVAKEPLDVQQIVNLGDIRARDDYFQDCLLRTLQFLDNTPAGYRLFHTSLAEYLDQESLQNETTTLAFYVNTASWHRWIADYYRLRYQQNWSQCDDYGLGYTLYHLLNADLPFAELEKNIRDLLTEEFINARGALTGWHRPLLQELYKLKEKQPYLIFKPCVEILGGSHRNSLVNQEVLRLLLEVNRQFRYSPLLGARQGSKEWIVMTVLDAMTRYRERAPQVLDALFEGVADVQMKGVIVLAMAENGEPDIWVKLLDILFDTTKYAHKPRDAGHLRWCAADGLLTLNEPDIVQPMLEKFKEPGTSPWLRQQILYVLGRMHAGIPLDEKYQIINTGLTLRQDCLPRVLDAIYLLAPPGGTARAEWSYCYEPDILAGLGLGEPAQRGKRKQWTYPLTIKRALTTLGKVGSQDAIIPLEGFIAAMTKQEKERSLDDQGKRLLEAARRARKDLSKRWD